MMSGLQKMFAIKETIEKRYSIPNQAICTTSKNLPTQMIFLNTLTNKMLPKKHYFFMLATTPMKIFPSKQQRN